MSYHQPPAMTAAHADALRTVIGLWPYPRQLDTSLLHDVLSHLDGLLTAPVPTRHSPVLDDWRIEYAPLDAPYEADQ